MSANTRSNARLRLLAATAAVAAVVAVLIASSPGAFAQNRPLAPPETVQYVKETALLANLAYCLDPTNFAAWACGLNCQQSQANFGARPFRMLQGPSTFGYAAVLDQRGTVVVAFRGAANTQNWMNSIGTSKTNWPFAKLSTGDPEVLPGMLRSYSELRQQIFQVIADLRAQFPGHIFQFTGQSLGGVLAHLAVVDLVSAGALPAAQTQLLTFMAPRIGNRDFAQATNNLGLRRRNRYTEGRDAVSRLAPRFLFGFHHFRGELNGQGPHMVVCADEGNEDAMCNILGAAPGDLACHLSFLTRPYFGRDNCNVALP